MTKVKRPRAEAPTEGDARSGERPRAAAARGRAAPRAEAAREQAAPRAEAAREQAAPRAEAAREQAAPHDHAPSFPIVGVGASAGGLEAFSLLLGALPADTGMAFVLIQHLDRTHPSMLAAALSSTTSMPVTQAEDCERVEPNHVYVIPPNADLALMSGLLTLLPRHNEKHQPHLPIDFFFRSLAEERGARAIGVVLSGSASDGTEGLKAIRGADGLTFVQEPSEAKFDSMPRSAIDAGVVDHVLPIAALAEELRRLSRHPYLSASPARPPKRDEVSLLKIFVLVRNAFGVDFSEYKRATFERRLARRMLLRKAASMPEYLRLLRQDTSEVASLYEDVLIPVTSFFRDPEVFEALKTRVVPKLLTGKLSGEPIRVWVAGCSTGEEVYSIAIALLEVLGEEANIHPIQIFGSDVSEKAIEQARFGVYREQRVKGLSEQRRNTFFSKYDAGLRINKGVRDLCVFVRHDLARDPPFSKLDLISCRNVLIYFGAALQRRVLQTFHYALRAGGCLLLGKTENISSHGPLFAELDKESKVFTRSAATSELRFAPRTERHPVTPAVSRRMANAPVTRGTEFAKQVERFLIGRYAPPGVVINARQEILQYFGETGRYLRPAAGEPQHSILKMARPGLLLALRAAIAQATKEGAAVRLEGVEVDQGDSVQRCDVVVEPFVSIALPEEPLFLVLFERPTTAPGAQSATHAELTSKASERRSTVQLERELAATQDYLQSLLDEQERTNDELNTANEELISSNEELQSMNEELETAKEELQSTNEELITVNDELQNRNHEAAEVNSDLLNLLSTFDLPIVILDAKRQIRRFNPTARSVLNILQSDVGRPIQDMRFNLRVEDLDQRVADVIESNAVHEWEVQDRNGSWYRMQIRPYKTVDQRIDGATISLIDIDALKRHLSEAEQATEAAERANRAKDEFLMVLSHELRTPLSTMLMQAQRLSRGDLPPADVKRAGEAIERGTRMQVQLIDDLLDVSRIVTGKLPIERRTVHLHAVIKAALEGVSAMIERKQLELSLRLDEGVGPVSGDPTRLQQVVANLLANAIKFSAEKGELLVTLEPFEGQARIRVSDTGIGIDPAFMPHVFSRFSQEDGTTVRRHGGLGLGLAIARHIVEAHGGKISAESAGKGKGATFSVLLPFAPAVVSHPNKNGGNGAKEPEPAPKRPKPLEALRVLCVDDDPGILDVVSQSLRDTGATVRQASSAHEAIAAAREFRPELLVCDIAMPDEDGYSLLQKLRALDAARGAAPIQALALTALAGAHHKAESLAAGFQMHLTKPIDLDQLTRAVVELAHRGDDAQH